MTLAEEIQFQLSGKKRRPYHRMTTSEKARCVAEYKSAPRGQKGPTADRLAGEIGCSRHWVIMTALNGLTAQVDGTDKAKTRSAEV